MLNIVNNRIIVLAVSLSFLCIGLSAQYTVQKKTIKSGETIQLFSDRALYTASENLYFTAFYQTDSYIKFKDWSSVLYVELIGWDGVKQAQGKFKIENRNAKGVLHIPESIKSGNYYLRAYTKWMRNYSPYSYSFLPIKIINNRNGEVYQGPASSNETNLKVIINKPKYTENIRFKSLHATYKCRNLVEFEISVDKQNGISPYCLSVFKSGDGISSACAYCSSPGVTKEMTESIEYLPEIRNLSLSGKIVRKSDQKALSEEKIFLSSTVQSFYFSSTTTDTNGAFFFTIPEYYGDHQFCLASEDENSDDIKVLIENEYCTQAVELPFLPFELSPAEEEYIQQLIINTKLNNVYQKKELSLETTKSIIPFYGKAPKIVYTKEYIQLIDLREIFYELVSEVFVEHSGDEIFLRLEKASSLSHLPPLILFDNIPVANDKSLLSISSKEIERIEVLNGGYIIGENKYSGLISIYSMKHDLAGMDMQKNNHFFRYALLSEYEFLSPDYSEMDKSRNADLRNLLYWEPHIELSAESTYKVCFYTSDDIGQYTIRISGIGEDGESPVCKTVDFIVEPHAAN